MPTAKELALRALRRTTRQLRHVTRGFPLERWRESPGGEANSLFGVLEHLVSCEDWWLHNIGEQPRLDAAARRRQIAACASAQEMLELLWSARRRLMRLLRQRPDASYERPVPTSRYGSRLQSGAELCCYIGEHDFYHAGQIAMLAMALAGGNAT